MEQRSLRLGDLVDDYCPRERRLTNHAVVAIVDDAIRQTRCTTCDAEHPYKDGKTPRRRKKGDKGELYDQVLAGVAGQLVVRNGDHPPAALADGTAGTGDDEPVVVVAAAIAAVELDADPEPAASSDSHDVSEARSGADDLWPAHRPLIRAQLPRIEGQQPQAQRPIHEFTMRQNGGRGPQSFRGGQGGGGWQDRNGNGGRGDQPGGFRQGRPQGAGRPGSGGGRPNRPGGGQGRRPR
jgi:hypothetical protein